MLRNLNLVLCLVAVLGLALFVRERSMMRELRLETERLANLYGLIVGESKNYVVKRVESDERSGFTWNVFSPRGLAISQKSIWAVDGSSSQPSASGGQFVLRCRLEFAADCIELQTITLSQSGNGGIGNAKLSRFIDDHWDELDIKLLADGEYAIDQVLSFVKIDLPDELVDELVTTMSDSRYEQLATKPFFEMQLGTQDAFEKSAQPEGAER